MFHDHKVSVIIPNYNHAKYLKQRIDSVLNQTFQDFELIILDDFSTDNSREIIEQYRSNSKVSHIVYNEINSGSTFKQWEKGIKLASGKYIWIAESDDWCEPNFLEELVNEVLKNPTITIAYAQSNYFIQNAILWTSSHSQQETISGVDFITTFMIDGNAIFNASMAIFKKQAFFKIDNEYVQYKFFGDWIFWISLAKIGDVFISDKVLNNFRKHAKDVSGDVYNSGLYFLEKPRFLYFLKKKKIVSEKKYVELLINTHLHYLVWKNNYLVEIQKKIENLFYDSEENFKYKNLLFKTSRYQRLKNLFKQIIEKNNGS